MTKEQAIEAMKAGKKVTHPFFLPTEWVSISDEGHIITENNTPINSEEFWSYRSGKSWQNDWSIFEDNSIPDELPTLKVCFFALKDGKYIAENGAEITTDMLVKHPHQIGENWSFIVLD